MGLKCPKCGVDNLLTAIFCRGCGDKLDLNAMKPEALLEDEHTKAQLKGASKAQKTFVGVFFGLLGVLILLSLFPVGVKGKVEGEVPEAISNAFASINVQTDVPPDDPAANPDNQGKKTKKKKKVKPQNFEAVDSDTASKLLSEAMGMPKTEWSGSLVPQQFSVDFLPEGNMKVVVKTKAFGFLPMACSANVKIIEITPAEAPSEEPPAEGAPKKKKNAKAPKVTGPKYDYQLSSPKLGVLPLVVCGDLSTNLIQNLLSSSPFFQKIKEAKEITTEAGKITVIFNTKPAK